MARVTKFRRGKIWWLWYPRKTGIPRRSLGTADAKTAEAIRAEEERRLALGEAGIHTPKPSTVRFSELARTFRERKAALQRQPETLSAIKAALVNFGTFLHVDEKAHLIDSAKIEAYVSHRLAAKKSIKTVINEIHVIGAAFAMGKKLRMIHENPMDFVELPKTEKRPPRYLTREQYKALMAKVNDETFRDIIDFYIITGARRSEGLEIRFSEHVDLEGGTLRIPQSKQKDYREIPIDRRLAAIIRRLHLQSKVPDRLISCSPDTLTTRFRDYVEKAQLPPSYTFHILRHTCATWRATAGTPWNVLQAFMGHKDPESTKVYTHTYESRDTLAASRLILPRN
jgi:integrase